MRIGEVIQIKESDMEEKIIHLSGEYTKNSRGRDVVMTRKSLSYITDIWLPQKADYLRKAQKRNVGFMGQIKEEMQPEIKKLDDDRIIPCTQSTLYEILMRGFKRAGFGSKKVDKFLYHPHGLAVLSEILQTISEGE